MGVRPPLPAPIKQRDQVNLASPERRGQNRLVAADFHWESDHGTFVTSQRALDYLIATRRLPTRRIGGRVLVPVSELRKICADRSSRPGRFLDPFGLGVIGCGSGCQTEGVAEEDFFECIGLLATVDNSGCGRSLDPSRLERSRCGGGRVRVRLSRHLRLPR